MSAVTARAQSRTEELANSLVHGTGLLASLAALPLLVVSASRTHQPLYLVGSVIFGVTMVLLYLASTVYHLLPESSAKRVFRVLDHSAIYLLIAGTYTPFAFGVLRGAWGWSIFGVTWSLAVLGIVSKATIGFRHPHLSILMYVAMGWMGIVAVQPLLAHVPVAGLVWLLAGGLCYTGGVIFYVTDARVRYGHAAWHVCVLAGTGCHFVAVLLHLAPPIG